MDIHALAMELAALLVLAFGAAAAGSGALALRKERNLRRHGARTTGTVVRMHRVRGKTGPIEYPVVQYTAADGRTVEVRTRIPGKRARPGSHLTVLHRPDRTQVIAVEGRGRTAIVTRIGFGAAAIVAGIALLAVTLP